MRREGRDRGVKKERQRRGRVEAEIKKSFFLEALRESKKKKKGGEEVMNCETKMQMGVIMEAVEE